uniref:C2H2-type domain-containing protein n=1 Tax=Neogobius melanostomus TaxID=47308 RepID=A0A8C6UIV5_9GOBI
MHSPHLGQPQVRNANHCATFYISTIVSSLIHRAVTIQILCCPLYLQLVEFYASHWKVPLPQLKVLEGALCCFTKASAFFTVDCDYVLRTLSSLALSIFELLLFFDQKDFTQNPLRKITVTFQKCCSSLERFQNVHLLQVERLLRAGGPWVSQTLHAILSESTLPQTEVEGCISSEPPVFFELRVRYLLTCERLPEAQALAKCCAQHPTVGQHLFFFHALFVLCPQVVDFSGKDAVNFICSLESEENDDLLLGLSRVFLFQQLRKGDMHFLWYERSDLVCLWGRLHNRLKTSKEAFLKECEQLILSATNVNAIFPFIRAITHELSEDGVQFCMELCANALRSCAPCDVITKSLIYKTMASLVPNDLEICRACALLVFFLERSVEAYKMVYILYMYPDQEYHVDCCTIGNRVRFETLQTLKKDLYFDPEFFNLIALRTSCLKLINEKVLSAALEEIMEEKWVPYCLREIKSSSSRSKFTRNNGLNKEQTLKGDRQNHKDTVDKAPARKVGRPRLNKKLPLNNKGNQESNLEFCCCLCHKDVKGRHLVAHAMFHYRKDECMFCGVAFKNDLKAMMHLSNHLEKLKKLQNPTANKSPKQSRAKAKQKTTVKDRTENDLITKTRLRHRSIENNEMKSVKIEEEKPLVIWSEQKHEEKATSKTTKQTANKNIGPQEKLCCPVDGCGWFTVKKHGAYLYHVLENHSLDTKPLELAFRVANNSCSICKRVLYSFEHFQHHVGRHKSEPRHPCPHKGCTARFKTTIEMRRHARKHNPLQAVCCLPGCPKLFICQWALILHEKDHFSKRSKSRSNDKPKSTHEVVNQEKQEDDVKKCVKSKEKVAPTSTGKSPKETNKAHNSATPKKDINAQSAATSINMKIQVDNGATKPEMQRVASVQNMTKPLDETCLKQRDGYDLVPEDEEDPLATFEKALNEYKKRPYMRLPATAYLEEKFTVMPKRRKDMSMFFGSSRKIQTTPQPQQRQRCANCFGTFSNEEELQWHLQQKCSSLFGFESDEEGE